MDGTQTANVAARARVARDRAIAARARAIQVAATVKDEPRPSRTFALSVLLALAVLALIRLPGLRLARAATNAENVLLNPPMLPHRWVATKAHAAVDRARDNAEEAGLAGLIVTGGVLELLDWKANRDAGRDGS